MSTPAADVRQRFIPVRYKILAEQLVKRFVLKSTDGLFSFVESDLADLRELAALIAEVIRQEADGLREDLGERYEHLNPDRDTLEVFAEETPEKTELFLRELSYIFDRAGFRPVDPKALRFALDQANVSGVEVGVDFRALEFLLMFERDRDHIDVKSPGFMNLFSRSVKVEAIRRLGVVFKIRGENGIYVKLFKDIPLPDLEAVLPGAAIRMSKSDKLWLTVTVGSAAPALAAVLLDNFNVINLFGEGAAFGERGLGVLQALGIALAGAAYKVYYSYSVLRDQAAGKLSRQLYYQQLNGNAGVLSLLLDLVGQQEAKVALTTYVMLLRSETPPETEGQLDRQIEQFLTNRFERQINFDLPTGIEALRRLNLWNGPEGGRPGVVPLQEALARLRAHAAARRTARHHIAAAAAGDAEAATLHRIGRPGKDLSR